MASPDPDRAEQAREILEANAYVTLATADADGRPWATPVWFAHDRYARLVWVSRPGARHSRNLAARTEVAGVVFDSTVAIGTGQGLYLEATAGPAPADEVDHLVAVFTARSEATGGVHWSGAEVSGTAPFRLYVADLAAAWILDDHDQRVPVDLGP